MGERATRLTVGGILAPIGAAIMTAAWTGASLPFHEIVMGIGFVTLIAGAAIIAWGIRTPIAREAVVAGDNYTNNGNNFGHMGPVNNYGKPEFKLTADLIRQIIEACPKGKTVVVHAVGHPTKSFPPSKTLAQALVNAGFSVEEDSTLMLMPAPLHHLSLDVHGEKTIVTVAPEA